MKTFALLFLSLLLGVQATNVVIYNYCGQTFTLWETFNDGGSNGVCDINPGGGTCVRGYGQGASFNLKGGQDGKTLAEFSIDSGGQDYYDVSRIVGYDFPMVLQPPESSCDFAVCTSPDCEPPAAYAPGNGESATHACGTGGTFKLFFCGQ